MGNDVSLNASFRSNLLSLKQTAKLQSRTQMRLSTGLKVNSATDNANSYYTAAVLNSRASDLSQLLDSMSQGIQSIKNASEALKTSAGFWEQATAVAMGSMQGVPIKLEKEWFAAQAGVAAVVTNAQELKAVLDSGKTGNIVVYGNIDMGNEAVVLKAGQSLVGVGHYADIDKRAADSEINKFSRITWQLNGGPGIYLEDNTTISNLSLNAVTNNRNEQALIYGSNKVGLVYENLDISIKEEDASTNPVGFAGIRGGTISLKGKINIRDLGEVVNENRDDKNFRVYGIVSATTSIGDDAKLNILMNGRLAHGVMNVTMNVSENAKVNIKTEGHSALGIAISTVNIKDNARININTVNSFGLYGGGLNILSSESLVNVSSGWGSFNVNDYNVAYQISSVAGGKIQTKDGLFVATQQFNLYPVADGDNPLINFDGTINNYWNRDSTKPAKMSDEFKKIFEDFLKDGDE